MMMMIRTIIQKVYTTTTTTTTRHSNFKIAVLSPPKREYLEMPLLLYPANKPLILFLSQREIYFQAELPPPPTRRLKSWYSSGGCKFLIGLKKTTIASKEKVFPAGACGWRTLTNRLGQVGPSVPRNNQVVRASQIKCGAIQFIQVIYVAATVRLIPRADPNRGADPNREQQYRKWALPIILCEL
jgi:hypothetical protein